MSAISIEGSLLDADSKYIVHQCNCITKNAAFLASDIFCKFPYSDIYSERIKKEGCRDKPGDIIVRGDGAKSRFVIAALGQIYPGKPRYANSDLDGYKVRKRYFFECLQKISTIEELDSIAFPYMIGCGAAGGDWKSYLSLIEKFSIHVKNKARVYIYKLPKV